MGAGRRLVIGATIAALLGLVLALSSPSAPAEAQKSAGAAPKIVVLGDSLSAGFGLPPNAAFPVQLQDILRQQGKSAEILNAGVSGDTASGGLERLDWAVPPDAAGVILELGANDALRGVDPEQTRKALETIVTRLRARGVDILLAGMQAPRNLDATYRSRFDAIYPDLAKAHDLLLYPFFMEGVALDPKLTLDDRLHPTAAGVAVIVKGILPDVLRLLERIDKKKG